MPFRVLDDGSRAWKPNPGPQSEFIALDEDFFEGFYGGAVAGGKSEALLAIPFARRCIEHPYWRGVIFRKTFPQLEESLIARSRELYGPLGGRYNDQKHVWTFPSGATLRFLHLEKESDMYQHDTAEFHYLGMDEITHFTRSSYLYLTHRCRSTVPGIRAFVRVSGTPGNIGHTWVRSRFIEPCRQGRRSLYDAPSKTYRIFIPARIQDNPVLLEQDPGYINRLYLLPEAERIAKMEGDWWIFAGQVFTEFREYHQPDEPANALHVVPEFNIEPWWPKGITIDWGYRAATWSALGAITPDNRVVMYREYQQRKKTVQEWGADLQRMIQFEENIRFAVIDKSANQNRGEPKTIYEQVIEGTDLKHLELGNSDRLDGKLLLHEYLRWKPRPARYVPQEGFSTTTSERILRTQGEEAYKSYLDLFKPDPPETNLPKLIIMQGRCPELVRAIQACVYEEAGKDGKPPEEVKEFDGDDPYDGIRYFLNRLDRYFKECADEGKRRARRQAIVDDLARTGDQTNFYRRMEKLDRDEKPKVVSIKRYQGTARRQYLTRAR